MRANASLGLDVLLDSSGKPWLLEAFGITVVHKLDRFLRLWGIIWRYLEPVNQHLTTKMHLSHKYPRLKTHHAMPCKNERERERDQGRQSNGRWLLRIWYCSVGSRLTNDCSRLFDYYLIII